VTFGDNLHVLAVATKHAPVHVRVHLMFEFITLIPSLKAKTTLWNDSLGKLEALLLSAHSGRC
jgi:hypothetical protein